MGVLGVLVLLLLLGNNTDSQRERKSELPCDIASQCVVSSELTRLEAFDTKAQKKGGRKKYRVQPRGSVFYHLCPVVVFNIPPANLSL